ncbi:MAG TPA: hypothetical protein VKE41_11180 [Roseiflexaceae bacterium]|nr:hypothetical protein [Roseiflexaceae bacterium]
MEGLRPSKNPLFSAPAGGSAASRGGKKKCSGRLASPGRGFRWTGAESLLRLPGQSPGAHVLDLTIAAPRPDAAPVPLTIAINDSVSISLAARGERTYHLLARARWAITSANDILIRSDVYTPAGATDGPPRELGVVVFEATWRSLGGTGWIIPL